MANCETPTRVMVYTGEPGSLQVSKVEGVRAVVLVEQENGDLVVIGTGCRGHQIELLEAGHEKLMGTFIEEDIKLANGFQQLLNGLFGDEKEPG